MRTSSRATAKTRSIWETRSRSACAAQHDPVAQRIRSRKDQILKEISVSLILICVGGLLAAQAPPSQDAALKQMYGNYDSATKTATLSCTDAQRIDNEKTHGSWWPCYADSSIVSVDILLTATVSIWTDPKHQTEETYFVTRAVPAHAVSGFDCHSCEPAIGVAQFTWEDQKWKLKASNATVGFYGAWGQAPYLELVAIGPSQYGILLSAEFGGQGYTFGSKWLLAPTGTTVSEIWKIQDEQDDFGAYDPKGVDGPSIQYRSSAAIRFGCIFDDSCANGNGYFDIEVISRGRDESGPRGSLRAQNWTDVYQFEDGKYKLVRHQRFVENKAF